MFMRVIHNRHAARVLRFSAILLWGALAGSGRAEIMAERYAVYGQLLVTQMVSAPFPHPKRAEGHDYKGTNYSAADHYSDSTVAVFVPKDLRENGPLDF